MENLPTIKVYDIDYEFIIKNYTDPKLWDKTWNLFIYKKYIFTLQLYSINVRDKCIKFEIRLSSDLDIWNNTKSLIIDYYINNMTIENLKQYINTSMINLVRYLESEWIEHKDKNYKLIEDARDEERESLREIAKDFLDDNGVSNDEIREVYIDYYVDKNESIYEKLSIYKSNVQYTFLTELYLILAAIMKDEDFKKVIINNQNKDINNLINEVNEFVEYMNTEEYVDEMSNNLESI